MVPPLNDELNPVNDEHVWAAHPTYSELAHTTFAGKTNYGKCKERLRIDWFGVVKPPVRQL